MNQFVLLAAMLLTLAGWFWLMRRKRRKLSLSS
ncbi:MAG: LPXTG cell wall anchor domain-containing protein [Candidatus Bathyarchaeia archaeon]